jgi:O-antigen ligase
MKNKIKFLYFASFIIFLLPSINLKIFFSHGIAKLIVLFIFFYFLIKRQRLLKNLKTSIFLKIYLVFFLFQSLSIISSISVENFIKKYIDIVFITLFLIEGLIIFKNKQKKDFLILFYLISIITTVNVFIKSFLFLNHNFFIYLLSFFLHPSYINLIEANLYRNRLYFSSFDEASLPFFLYFFIKQKNFLKKLFFLLIFFLIIFTTVVSNYRTNLLMLLFSIFFSFYLFKRYFKKYMILIYLFLLIILFIFLNNTKEIVGESLIDRFFLSEKNNISTIETRKNQMFISLDLGKKSFFGVGLNNFFIYQKNQRSFFNNKYNQILFDESNKYPHNIFASILAESGFFSLILYLLIISMFIKNDLNKIKINSIFNKLIIISFWDLFIYSLFNPTDFFYFNIYFWLLRIFLL